MGLLSIGRKLYILIGVVVIMLFSARTVDASILEPDTTFGDNGVLEFENVEGNFENMNSFQRLSNGKYLLGGYSDGAQADSLIIRLNSDGSLDSTFNSLGYGKHDLSGSGDNDYITSVSVDSSGKYLTCGYAQQLAGLVVVVARFNSDGSLDSTLNGTGYITYGNTLGGNNDSCANILVDQDGKYLLTGFSQDGFSAGWMVVWRFNVDGTLDSTFNSTGYFVLDSPPGSFGSRGYSSALGGGGKYLITGFVIPDISGTPEMVVARLNSDGQLDTTFNGTGYLIDDAEPMLTTHSSGNTIRSLPSGKILVGGTGGLDLEGYTNMILWRLNSDGTLDTSFLGQGYAYFDGVALASEESMYAIEVDPNGKYFVSGYGANGPFVLRFNSNGTVDTTFNETGYIEYTDLNVSSYYPQIDITTTGIYTVHLWFETKSGGFTSKFYRYVNLYQIDGLGGDLSAAYNEVPIEVGDPDGAYGDVLLRLSDGGVPLAEVVTSMVEDQDWSSVSGESDMSSFKAYVHNLASAPGTGSYYTLYIPKRSGDNSVGICPGATSLAEVSDGCSGLVTLTQTDSNLSEVVIDSITYWKVDNLSSTGGFSFAAQPPVVDPPSSSGSTPQSGGLTLANTGLYTQFLTGLATLALTILVSMVARFRPELGKLISK